MCLGNERKAVILLLGKNQVVGLLKAVLSVVIEVILITYLLHSLSPSVNACPRIERLSLQ